MERHACNRESKSGWAHCCICDGRIHLAGCTAKLNKHKDCCAARHRMLHDKGQIRGLTDSSFYMWHPDFPEGWHPADQSGHKPKDN